MSQTFPRQRVEWYLHTFTQALDLDGYLNGKQREAEAEGRGLAIAAFGYVEPGWYLLIYTYPA